MAEILVACEGKPIDWAEMMYKPLEKELRVVDIMKE